MSLLFVLLYSSRLQKYKKKTTRPKKSLNNSQTSPPLYHNLLTPNIFHS